MQPFHHQISQARKAHHMTQEQLASAMNVSRQTVSHWENGRIRPDAQTTARLAELLDLNAAQPCKETRRRSAVRPFLLGFACGVLSVLLILYAATLLPAMRKTAETPKNADTPLTQADPLPRYDPDWYQLPNVREDGKAYLNFSLVRDPITVIERDREPYVGWEVDYRFEEMNGVAFTITAFTEVYFTADREITYSSTFKGDELSIPFDYTEIPANGRVRYSVFKPVDATVLYAACIEGVDENGNEVVFRYTIPLSQEIQE